jgi:aminopeptidase
MRVTTDDTKLAKIIVNHSLKLKPKERLLIAVSEFSENPLVKAIFIEALKLGAYPLLDIAGVNFYRNRAHVSGLAYQFYELANDWQLQYIPKEILDATIDWADAFVNIVSVDNTKELSQIDSKKLMTRSKKMEPIIDKLIDSDRWVLTYYPTPSMAQEANVSFDWLLDFYYNACLVDYQKMEKELGGLEKVMDKGKAVHIVGENTDITFSIAGRLAKACFGQRNIPDGEVFLAPNQESVNGKIYFEMPTLYAGREMQGVYMEFKDGKVVKSDAQMGASQVENLLKTDKGSCMLGEFAIGANYQIQNAMKNTLFDEKIGGTLHMALGRAYKEKRGGAPKGGNDSAIHWDIVKDMREAGSYVEVDNTKILVNGKIVV